MPCQYEVYPTLSSPALVAKFQRGLDINGDNLQDEGIFIDDIDPGKYFLDMVEEVFGESAFKFKRKENSESNKGSTPSESGGPLIPLYSTPSLLPLSGEVQSKVNKFEEYYSTTPRDDISSEKTRLWFHKDGVRSPPERPHLLPERPPKHPNSPVSPRSSCVTHRNTPKSLKESNQILRNSLGKMEPSERLKLEEILEMCIEYEKQIETQLQQRTNGGDVSNKTPTLLNGSNSSIALSSPNNIIQPNRIKTNGSLPRDKRQTSPSTEADNVFNFEKIEGGVQRSSEEVAVAPLFMPPSSPRTRIKTTLGGSSGSPRLSASPPSVRNAVDLSEIREGEEEDWYPTNLASSPSSTHTRRPPRSKHDRDPASPIKFYEDIPLILPSEEASSRVLIGTTMLNHKISGSALKNIFPSPSKSTPSYSSQELDKSFKLIEGLRSDRHNQVLIISAIKKQLAELESDVSEGIKEFELERSLLIGERESEAIDVKKLRIRCGHLRTQEARLSGVFQELQKSLSRKTENAKKKIVDANNEIQRLHNLLSNLKSDDIKEEANLLQQLKEQHEIRDTETKAFEDLEFHQMEEETSKETEREELLKEIQDVENLVLERSKTLKEIDNQRKIMLIEARKEIHKSENLRQKLICDLEREKIKLNSIERKLSGFAVEEDLVKSLVGEERVSRDALVSISSIEEDEEDETCYWRKNSELEDALKRLSLMDEDDIKSASSLPSVNGMNGSGESEKMSSVAESISGHSTTAEESEDECFQDGVGNQQLRTENALLNKKLQVNKNEMNNSCNNSHSSTDSTKSSYFTNKNSSPTFKDSSSRPMSDESSLWDENDSSSVEVRRREHKLQQQRPLTRYLPIRNEGFDLRAHIESAGHPIESSSAVTRHIVLNSSSCRGHLYKMSSKFRKWNRRWFVFDRYKRTLIYYSDKSESKAKGGIYFEYIEDVYVDHLNSLKSPRPKETFFMKTQERLYCLMAPTIETMRIWIDVIFTGAEGFQGYQK